MQLFLPIAQLSQQHPRFFPFEEILRHLGRPQHGTHVRQLRCLVGIPIGAFPFQIPSDLRQGPVDTRKMMIMSLYTGSLKPKAHVVRETG